MAAPSRREDEPRRVIEPVPEGSDVFVTVSPGTLPCSSSEGVENAPLFYWSAFTVVIELVTSLRVMLPYPTTTTSSNVWESSSITTLIALWFT